MRVLIAGGGTGGHLMPALALADAFVEVNASVEPVLVGAARGVEASVLPNRPYRFHLLSLEPIYRREWWKNLRWITLWRRLLHECDAVLDAEMPAVVVGTGGYAAGPLLLKASGRGLPLALQEQNAFPGLTTRWLARRANQVFLGFPEAKASLKLGPNTEVHLYGNPIAPPTNAGGVSGVGKTALGIGENKPVLFVMGGSQGALRINEAVADLVEADALDDVVLLWSTGRATWDRFAKYHAPPDRVVKAFWDPIGHAYSAADLVISRSGAMSTAELCAWGLPSILVPLPTAAADHQTKNAEALAAAGAAIHVSESELSTGRLAEHVRGLLRDNESLAEMASRALARGLPEAARNIVTEVLSMVS